MELPTPHTHVATVIERKHQRIAQKPLKWMVLRVAFNPDYLHSIVDALDRLLGTVDLGDIRDFGTAVSMRIKICASTPGQISTCFDAHFDVGQGIANRLMVDDRDATKAFPGLCKLKRIVERSSCSTDTRSPD